MQASLPPSSDILTSLYRPFVYGGSDNRVSLSVEKGPRGEDRPRSRSHKPIV